MAPQVLVLGMPRTGTQSIGVALSALGYSNAYHMTTVGPSNHHDKWVAALEAKFEQKGAEFGKKEFDELLAGFDVVSDIPCSIFYRELMTAYPDAHVILTTRNEDAWVESISKTLHLAYSKAQAKPSKLASLYHLHLWGDDFIANGRKAFRQHNQSVIETAAAQGRRVLQFDPSQGWQTLCDFLEKPIPTIDYPRKDMWAGYKNMVKEVEAGRLTEDAITIKSQLGPTSEGIKSAYIYTQSPREQAEGIKSAYIYTQSPREQVEGIKSAYIYTQSPREQAEGIKSAYIYTQSPREQAEGIRSAYIYTQSPREQVEGIKSAYIYTQSPRDNDLLRMKGEGIKAAYIYTQ